MTSAQATQTKQQARYKVGKTQSVTYNTPPDLTKIRIAPRSTAIEYGYGFSIQNAHGAPLLNITYATEAEAEQAEEAIRQAIENAVDIVSNHGF